MSRIDITGRFGASVRKLRFQLGLSQEELAERAALHRTYIAGIEGGGRNLTLRSIAKLAHALRVPTAALLLSATESAAGVDLSAGKFPTINCRDILIVDDNPDDVALTLQAFRKARITNSVQVATDGSEALDFLFCRGSFSRRKPGEQPGLVLLDLNLPKVDGLEVLRRMKNDAHTKPIPVAVLTASNSSAEYAECRRWGVLTYLTKPVDFERPTQATGRLKLNWALHEPPEARGRMQT